MISPYSLRRILYICYIRIYQEIVIMLLKQKYALREHNTFHLDVCARWYAEYNTSEELVELLQSDLLKEQPFFHIGAGSNLLFTSDYAGVILHSAIRFIKRERENEQYVWVRAGSGVVWDDFCAYSVENNLGGCENLSYIPGEIGASAVQNIGAYGIEACDLIEEVETIEVATGEKRVFHNEECGYGYRASKFKTEWKGKYIVTSVLYRLDKTPNYTLDYGNLKEEVERRGSLSLANVRDAVIAIRKSKLPEPDEYGNAGSFFMNPVISRIQYENLLSSYPQMPHYSVNDEYVKVPAAWMIEQCGWKGKSWGGAAVHDRQCLVLINKKGATAHEIMSLAQAICDSVKDKFGIKISPEVNYI